MRTHFLLPLSFAALPLLGAVLPAKKPQEPTFTKEIAPIVFAHCTPCHRPGEAAPFSLLTYADVQKRGALIAEVTAAKTMPPWSPGPSDYAFHDDTHLSDAQLATLQKWVKAGMPEGDPKDLPAPPSVTPGWRLGPPDLIVKMPAAFPVPASGPDIYRNFVLPLNLSEDVWISAIDFRPSERSVVHHSLFFADSTGELKKRTSSDGKPGYDGGMGGVISKKDLAGALRRFQSAGKGGANSMSSLGGWAVGAQPALLPGGLAYPVPKGSDLVLSTHFHPSGKAEQEQSVVGIYFAKKPPAKTFTTVQLPPLFGVFSGMKIPAGAKDYTLKDSFTLPVAVKAFGVGGHAHYLGKTMKLTATLPDKSVKTLLWIPDWDFSWQGQYFYKDFAALPAGTRLDVEIHFDNSAENPRNPASPPKEVRWGEQSEDEMGSVSLRLVAENESELPTLQKAYREHLKAAFMKNPRSVLGTL